MDYQHSSLFTFITLFMTIASGVILFKIIPTSFFPITFISLLGCTMFGFERVGKAIDKTLYNSIVLLYNIIIALDNATWNITSNTIQTISYIMECIAYPFEYIETKFARLLGIYTRREREEEMIYAFVTSASNPLDIIKYAALVYLSIILYTFFM